MKVIINAKKDSLLSKYNGLTFDAKVYNDTLAIVNISEIGIDQRFFNFKELIIVDFAREANESIDNIRVHGNSVERAKIDLFLTNYQKYKKIQFEPSYNQVVGVARNDEFFKEFKEISYSVNNQLYDFRLKSYEEFRGMFSRNMEIRFPFAPETEAFIKQLYSSITTLK